MTKLDHTLEKLNGTLYRLEKHYLEIIQKNEEGNKLYREEILRLENTIKGLIQVIVEMKIKK